MSVCYYREDTDRQAHEYCLGIITQEIQVKLQSTLTLSQIQENTSQNCTLISTDNSLQRITLDCATYSGKLP